MRDLVDMMVIITVLVNIYSTVKVRTIITRYTTINVKMIAETNFDLSLSIKQYKPPHEATSATDVKINC